MEEADNDKLTGGNTFQIATRGAFKVLYNYVMKKYVGACW